MAVTITAEEADSEYELPRLTLGDFPVIETPFFSRKYLGITFMGVGVAYSPLMFILPHPISAFFTLYFFGLGAGNYGYNEWRKSRINKALSRLTTPDTTAQGWMYWAARTCCEIPRIDLLKEIEQCLLENTRQVSKGQYHIVGRNLTSRIEVNLYPLQNEVTLVDLLSSAILGAQSKGEYLLDRLATAEKNYRR